MEKTKIIVDTDIGSDIDDALCFAYLLNDAYSAEILFNSGAKIIVGGLDISLRTKTSAKEFLSKEHTGINKALALYVEKFFDRYNKIVEI